jgi:hypothetical protein
VRATVFSSFAPDSLTTDSESRLAGLVAGEQDRPVSAAALALCDAVRERHGSGVAAILFYGSCLRRSTNEGVHDFYVVVDSYRSVYGNGYLATSNYLLPPNVYTIEAETGSDKHRAKYAVISMSAFESCVSPSCLHPYIWARFAQPSLIVAARDREARERVLAALAQAIVTFVQRLAVFMPVSSGRQRFSLAKFWQDAFRRTYSAELRNEKPEAIRAIYDSAPERFDEAARWALDELEAQGQLTVLQRGGSVDVEMSVGRRAAARWRWRLTRPLAKFIGFLRLLKTATTFGDWLPYIVWKLERHGGKPVELSDRQRRHPLIFAWPVLFRLIAKKELR